MSCTKIRKETHDGKDVGHMDLRMVDKRKETKMLLKTDTEDRHFNAGAIVQHFKKQWTKTEHMYLYRILAIAEHTESGEKLVVYQALYGENKVYARPYDSFCAETDVTKYPEAEQKYRFEKLAWEQQL